MSVIVKKTQTLAHPNYFTVIYMEEKIFVNKICAIKKMLKLSTVFWKTFSICTITSE